MPPPGSHSVTPMGMKRPRAPPHILPMIKEESRSTIGDDTTSAYDEINLHDENHELPTILEARNRVEHDQNGKKGFVKCTKRRSILGALLVGIAMVVIIAVSVASNQRKSDETISQEAPTGPEVVPPHGSVRDILAPLVLQKGAEFEGDTYQSQVVEVLETDKILAEYIRDDDATKLLQRYALLCIYYATNEVETAVSTETYPDGIPSWKSPWTDLSKSECEWPGVQCDSTKLALTLDLSGFQLTGTLPPEITLLSLVWEHLILDNNPGFGGPFPAFLTKPWLTTLSMRNTAYSGDIPSKMCSSRLKIFVDCGEIQCPANCCQPCSNGESPMNPSPTGAPTMSSQPDNGGGKSGGLSETELMDHLFYPIEDAPVELDSIDDTLFNDEDSYRLKAWKNLRRSENIAHLKKERIVERYALLCFFFATNNVPSDSTGTVGHIVGPWKKVWNQVDRLDGDYCAWNGVTCNGDGRVTRIWLHSNNLTGGLPPELTLLKNLRILNFRNNQGLKGDLPYFIGKIPSYVRGDLGGTNYDFVPQWICQDKNGNLIEGVLFVECKSLECPCCSCRDGGGRNL